MTERRRKLFTVAYRLAEKNENTTDLEKLRGEIYRALEENGNDTFLTNLFVAVYEDIRRKLK